MPLASVPRLCAYALILALVAALCAGEAAGNQRKTPGADSTLGGIAVSIKLKGPTMLSVSSHATAAFFVKAGESTDVFHSTEFLPSNYAEDDQVYLLNVEPGKYVLIGAFTPKQEGAPNAPELPSANTYFDQATIKATEVTVEAGRFAFMGDIVAKTSTGMGHADDAQNFYGDLIGRGMKMEPGFSVAVATGHKPVYGVSISPGHVTRAGTLKSLDRDAETERKFWTKAINKVLDDEPDWQQLARTRLDALH